MKYFLIPIILLAGCASRYKTKMESYKIKDTDVYLSDSEITDEKYEAYKAAICLKMKDENCKSEFYKQFLYKLKSKYSFSANELNAYCRANQIECLIPKNTERYVRGLHNQTVDNVVAKQEAEASANASGAFAAMLGGVNQSLKDSQGTNCTYTRLGNTIQSNCR